MDQESFRRILGSQQAGSSSAKPTTSRGSLLTAAAKPKKKDAGKPAFKPRKVKDEAGEDAKDSKYRDRASERRLGAGNDFAHVEAVLEDFEKRTKDAQDLAEIEEKRKFLGGDGDHSVLVKGLDFALLEQNKARSALVTDALDDDSLERVFQEVSTGDKPKKRTRQDLLRELKEKRASGDNGATLENLGDGLERSDSAEAEARKLEEAKKKGKFKPIGFKPIAQPVAEGNKKKKAKGEGTNGERRKKKRKLEATACDAQPTAASTTGTVQPTGSSKPSAPPPPPPEPIDDDFDIFADAGDYDGLQLGEEDDEEDNAGKANPKVVTEDECEDLAPKQWIPVEDGGPILHRQTSEQPIAAPSLQQEPESSPRAAGPPALRDGDEVAEMEDEIPMRLVPLASSALPDIKGLLQMDRAASSSYKNKKRKDKKKTESGADSKDSKPSAEERAERDYKKLKAYTDKKGGK